MRIPKKNAAEAIRAAILRIPQGQVSTYGQVAEAAGYPGHHRQVAQILNKFGVGLPWHRVVGAGGVIKTRFETAAEQRLLLRMEGVRFRGVRAEMTAARHKAGDVEAYIAPRRKPKK